jgi:hypothetical protein
MARLSAGSGVAGAIIALRLLGMNQFGYPLFGFIAAQAKVLEPLAQFLPASAMIAPLLVIAFMISIALAVLLGLGTLVLVSSNAHPKWLQPKWVFRLPLILASTLLIGLTLLKLFPEDVELPEKPTSAHFIFPIFLLAIACILKRHTSQPSLSKTASTTQQPNPF